MVELDGPTDDTTLSPTRWSWRSVVLYGLAAIAAIVVGVIPALWINSRRAEAVEAAPAAETPAPTITAQPIESAPPAPAPTVTATAAEPRAAIAPIAKPASKPAKRPARAKAPERKPPQRTVTKRPPSTDCDVYLHPHGCPH